MPSDRPSPILLAEVGRAEFDDSVTEAELRALAGRPRIDTLQCAAPVSDHVWPLLNDVFFASRPDVCLRLYGHYGTTCDLRFAARMTNVRRFSADCLMRVANVEAIADMPALEDLGLDVYELEDFRVLNRIAPGLTALALGATRGKKARLDPVARFTSLKTLFIEGQARGIESLGALQRLETLTLRSVTTPDLRYLAGLDRLRSLDIKLGGIRSFEGVNGKSSITRLELWQIRELKSIDIVAALPGLQNLFVQSLPGVRRLPALDQSVSLRRVVMQNMKGLETFAPLESAPTLEEFALFDGRPHQPDHLLPVLRNPAVRGVCAFFGSHRRNDAFARLRDQYGKQEWDLLAPFEYR